jgi:hypothetical protein
MTSVLGGPYGDPHGSGTLIITSGSIGAFEWQKSPKTPLTQVKGGYPDRLLDM